MPPRRRASNLVSILGAALALTAVATASAAAGPAWALPRADTSIHAARSDDPCARETGDFRPCHALGWRPGTGTTGTRGTTDAALTIAAGLVLVLLGGGPSLVRLLRGPRFEPLLDADGNRLVVQDGSYQGGGPGQVWYDGHWVDREVAIREVEADRRADTIRGQEADAFRDQTERDVDQWLHDAVIRGEHEAATDHARRVARQAEIDALVHQARIERRRAWRSVQRMYEAEARLHLADTDRYDRWAGNAESVLWVADRGIDLLADLTGPTGKGIKAGYNVAKGLGRGASEAYHLGGRRFLVGAGEGIADVVMDLAQDRLKFRVPKPMQGFARRLPAGLGGSGSVDMTNPAQRLARHMIGSVDPRALPADGGWLRWGARQLRRVPIVDAPFGDASHGWAGQSLWNLGRAAAGQGGAGAQRVVVRTAGRALHHSLQGYALEDQTWKSVVKHVTGLSADPFATPPR